MVDDGDLDWLKELVHVEVVPMRGWLFEERGGARPDRPVTRTDALRSRSVKVAKLPEGPRHQDRQPAGSDVVVRRAAAHCAKRMCVAIRSVCR